MTEGAGAPLDDRYVGFREHAALQDRVTKLESSLMHLPADVHSLRRELADVAASLRGIDRKLEDHRPDPGMQQAALALHSVAEAIRKPDAPAAPPPFQLSPTMVATVAGGLLLLGALMGQAVGVQHLLGNP